MATKKQKRAAGLAKHEAFISEERARGAEALRKDRERELNALTSMAKKVSPNLNHDRLKFLEKSLSV